MDARTTSSEKRTRHRRSVVRMLHGCLLLAILGLMPGVSSASYIWTYGEIESLYDALTRVALIFSDNTYTSLAYAIGYAGITVGAAATIASIAQGKIVSPIAFLVPFVMGAAIMSALIVPKEPLFLIDLTHARVETVPDMPVSLARTMQYLGQVRLAIIDMIDTSAPPGPPMIWQYKYNANGQVFDILMRVMEKAGTIPDTYLDASIRKYINDCVPEALQNQNNSLDWNVINSGSTDLRDELAKGANPAIPTRYFTSKNKAGVSSNCQDSWNHIQTALDGINFKDMIEKIILSACNEAGMQTTLNTNSSTPTGSSTTGTISFNWSDSQCLGIFAESVRVLVGETGTAPWAITANDAWRWARQLYLGRKIHEWATSAAPTQLGNYYQVIDRIGWARQAMQWAPTVRSAIFAFAVALIPFSILFLLTGAGLRALMFPIGMLVFVTVWDIMEAVAHVFLVNNAFRVFTEAAQHNLGLIAMAMLAPASVKTLSAFATIRVMSAIMATSFMYVVFRYGGMAMASLTSSFTQAAQQHGTEAMRRTSDPVEHGQWLSALNQSNATQFAAASVGGPGHLFNATAGESAERAVTSQVTNQGLHGAGARAENRGTLGGAGNVGHTLGQVAAGGAPAVQRAAQANATVETAEGVGKQKAIDTNTHAVNDYTAKGEKEAGEAMGKGEGYADQARMYANTPADLGRRIGNWGAASQVAMMNILEAVRSAVSPGAGGSLSKDANGNLVFTIDGNRTEGMVAAQISRNGTITISGDGNTMKKAMQIYGRPKGMTEADYQNAISHGGTLTITPNPQKLIEAEKTGDYSGIAERVQFTARDDSSIKEGSDTDRSTKVSAGPQAPDSASAQQGLESFRENTLKGLKEDARDSDGLTFQEAFARLKQYTETLAKSMGIDQTSAVYSDQGISHKTSNAQAGISWHGNGATVSSGTKDVALMNGQAGGSLLHKTLSEQAEKMANYVNQVRAEHGNTDHAVEGAFKGFEAAVRQELEIYARRIEQTSEAQGEDVRNGSKGLGTQNNPQEKNGKQAPSLPSLDSL